MKNRKIVKLINASILLSVLISGPVLGGDKEYADQQQIQSNGEYRSASAAVSLGQRFRPEIKGRLTRVDLELQRVPGTTSDNVLIQPGDLSYGLLFNNEMAVFDPSRNVYFYEHFAKDHRCRIVKTFETHLQADYISGSQELSKRAGAVILGHENDFQHAVFSYTRVKEGDVFRLSSGGPEIRAVHMAGHTPGSTSYLIDGTYLISGDAIFILSIGRPDLGGKAVEWAKLLFKTIKTQIAGLDDSIVVLPGHYMEWSEMDSKGLFADPLGNVRRRNANIYGIGDEKDFIKFIQDNIRAQPEVYA